MPKLQIHDQEEQKQLWRMRWFFIVFFPCLTFIASVAIFYIITSFVSTKTSGLPLIPILSSLGLSSFWSLTQQLAKYLFPMRKWEFELAKEKLRLSKQRRGKKVTP
jgi:hypothetical protein